MMSNSEFGSISFDLPKNQSNVIKVIGVGGGGNAINHMFKQGIKGVDFIVVTQTLKLYKVVPCLTKFSWECI
jgi:cell division GTPase FtsZ